MKREFLQNFKVGDQPLHQGGGNVTTTVSLRI